MNENDPDGHVNFATFGFSRLNDRQRFYDLTVKTKRMDGPTTTLAWREAYETHFGIFDHDHPQAAVNDPLALVGWHPKEDFFRYSSTLRFMWKYREYPILKEWGYNFSQFLELPWYYTQVIFDIEQRVAKEDARRETEMKRAQEAAEREQETRMQYPGHRYAPSTPPRRGGRS